MDHATIVMAAAAPRARNPEHFAKLVWLLIVNVLQGEWPRVHTSLHNCTSAFSQCLHVDRFHENGGQVLCGRPLDPQCVRPLHLLFGQLYGALARTDWPCIETFAAQILKVADCGDAHGVVCDPDPAHKNSQLGFFKLRLPYDWTEYNTQHVVLPPEFRAAMYASWLYMHAEQVGFGPLPTESAAEVDKFIDLFYKVVKQASKPTSRKRSRSPSPEQRRVRQQTESGQQPALIQNTAQRPRVIPRASRAIRRPAMPTMPDAAVSHQWQGGVGGNMGIAENHAPLHRSMSRNPIVERSAGQHYEEPGNFSFGSGGEEWQTSLRSGPAIAGSQARSLTNTIPQVSTSYQHNEVPGTFGPEGDWDPLSAGNPQLHGNFASIPPLPRHPGMHHVEEPGRSSSEQEWQNVRRNDSVRAGNHAQPPGGIPAINQASHQEGEELGRIGFGAASEEWQGEKWQGEEWQGEEWQGEEW